jgi:hypothetical protein
MSSLIWGWWPDIYYCLTATVLFFWGALSDERMGVFFIFCWSSPAQSLSGPIPLVVATIFHCLKFYQSQSHIATDGQSVSQSVSKSWCRAPSGAHDQIFITLWQLRYCFSGALSPMRGRICLLYILLALAIMVFLSFESLGTRDHILLSQIWDFPFRRLLRLAGSRWRYSTPPPHGGQVLRLACIILLCIANRIQVTTSYSSSVILLFRCHGNIC